jgi:hypothetical protein
MNKKPITIIALIILGLCLLGKLLMKGNKNVDMGCNIILFIAIVLLAVNQLLNEEKFEQLEYIDESTFLDQDTDCNFDTDCPTGKVCHFKPTKENPEGGTCVPDLCLHHVDNEGNPAPCSEGPEQACGYQMSGLDGRNTDWMKNAHRDCCDSGRTKFCADCPGLQTGRVLDVCLLQKIGKSCVSNDMCKDDGYCPTIDQDKNTPGQCTDYKKNGASCTQDYECKSKACGRPEAGTDNLICCPSGKTDMYLGYDYCTEMPSGKKCWTDAMCASGDCVDNWSGIVKGSCS